MSHNPLVRGSTPRGLTNKVKGLDENLSPFFLLSRVGTV